MNKEELKIQLALGSLSYEDKWHIARNPSTPIELLEYLSKDEDIFVSANVADNPNTPIELLEKLSKDKSRLVRHYAVKNLMKRNND